MVVEAVTSGEAVGDSFLVPPKLSSELERTVVSGAEGETKCYNNCPLFTYYSLLG